MRLQLLLMAVVAFASCESVTAVDTKTDHSALVDLSPESRSVSKSGAEMRFLRRANTVDDDDEDEDLLDLEDRGGLTTPQVEQMLGEIDNGVIKTKHFKYYRDIDAKPDTLYRTWGFSLNGVNPNDPRYQFWERYRDWFYKKYPVK